ncbi:hypothetical protein EVAR_62000_1 [Eumeta japonica]|uniref:Uncharacterized protein n=1 Tax=Eumeta variegata TaxID=151549 RepID=A0A4C1YGS4_EUMVA|nr:hypothetical protein EVAR_62000_1 [Eumeta japonica]
MIIKNLAVVRRNTCRAVLHSNPLSGERLSKDLISCWRNENRLVPFPSAAACAAPRGDSFRRRRAGRRAGPGPANLIRQTGLPAPRTARPPTCAGELTSRAALNDS